MSTEAPNLNDHQAKTVENRFSLPIKICCASCQHKRYDQHGTRKCVLHDAEHYERIGVACNEWEMSDFYTNLDITAMETSNKSMPRDLVMFIAGWRGAEAAHKIGHRQKKDSETVRHSYYQRKYSE